MINLIFVDFFNNLLFYNFLNNYQNQYPNHFIINFNIKYIEGNFPHSFFTEYNYLNKNNDKYIDKLFLLDFFQYNTLPICLDLNNKNLKENDLIDKYLLMILLTLNNQNYYVHCNNHRLCEILFSSGLNYIYIDDTYSTILNKPNTQLEEENQIYNFSKIKTQFKNDILIDFDNLDKKQNYKLMINNPLNIISNLILPQYQFIFYKEYLEYEKEMLCYSRTLGTL